ncbi:unnamed protein product [Coregonus sp. 'balchen']|nr:unnamed protein product [Coregonus sp. 'balchen']
MPVLPARCLPSLLCACPPCYVPVLPARCLSSLLGDCPPCYVPVLPARSLAVGTKTGYKLFSVTSVDKLDCIYESETPDVYIVERLFSSSLVVVVSLSMPRRMNVYHFKKGTEICNYSYSNHILSVRLNRQTQQTGTVDWTRIHTWIHADMHGQICRSLAKQQ